MCILWMISYWYSWIQPCWMHLLSVFVSWLTLAIGGTAYHNGAIINFELEFALKYFFLSIYAFSSHSIFKISNSKEEFSVGLLIHCLTKFCHPYFPLIFLNATCHFLSFQTRYFCLVLDSNCKFWHFDTSQFLVFCYRFTSKWQNFL